jgi:hypothetical protein
MKLRNGTTTQYLSDADNAPVNDKSEHYFQTKYNLLSSERKLELGVNLTTVIEEIEEFIIDFNERYGNNPENNVDTWFKLVVLKMRSSRGLTYDKKLWRKLDRMMKSSVTHRMINGIEDFANNYPEICDYTYPCVPVYDWVVFIEKLDTEVDEFKSNLTIKLAKVTTSMKMPFIKRMNELGNFMESINEELPDIYEVQPTDSMTELVLTTYQKCIELMANMIKKTYFDESHSDSPLCYGNNGKIAFIETLSKLHRASSAIAVMMCDIRDNTTTIANILKLAEPGTRMNDSSEITKKTYLCYRHLDCCGDMYVYEMNTYIYDEYTEVELYDYYFLPNQNENVNDDVFINGAYYRWFVDVEEKYKVCGCGYDDCPECNSVHPVAYVFFSEDELNMRMEHHRLELDRYTKMKHHMYDDNE